MYRLIIADDEENIRNGMAHSLPWREWGYEVAALCASGQEVLDQMASCKPDVVLSDIRMPGMDGLELMQRLSRDYPQVKIVILSGYSDFKYLNMSIRSHVAEYLLKPTDIDDFEETFRRLKASMDHERLRRAQITESVLRHFHAWLSALLGGVATPEDTDRFLPMLTEAGIDLDNLQIAAFVLDGHGGDQLCLSLLFHVSLWGLRYGIQMEEVLRSLGAHYTDIYALRQAGLCAGLPVRVPAGAGGPPSQPQPHRQERGHEGAGICGRRILLQRPLAGECGRLCAQDAGVHLPGVQK